MSVMTPSPPGPIAALDTSGTARVPFARLVSVEFRKMWDTLTGFWLLLITGLLLVIAAGAILLISLLNDLTVSATDVVQIMVIPISLLVPVLAIVSVTSEWSQRTGLVTFTLEPGRMRVIAAKLATVVLLALATIVWAAVVGALTYALYAGLTDQGTDWTIDGSVLFWSVISQMLGLLTAFGLGLVFLSTPAAVAVYYIVALLLPNLVYGPVQFLVSWGPDVVPWLDRSFAMNPLTAGQSDIDGKVYAQVAVTTLIWVVAPIVIGWTRVRRAEIK